MALYLYGSSALDVMRYLRAIEDGTVPGISIRPKRLGGAVHTNRQLNQLNHQAQLLLSHVRGPLHALVSARGQATRTRRLITHVWSSEIPAGAYRDLGNGICLTTPAFLFQQMAAELGELDLLLLGLELCGFYSKWSFPTAKSAHTADDEFRGCTFELKPATTVGKLTHFMQFRKGERGHAAASHALRRVIDNSASPMESAAYLLLCLPRRLGGYALPAPVLNTEVKVSTSTTTEVRYPDLYWPSHSLDVEYQSDRDHSGDWSRYRDARRMVELAAERITVLPLTRAQLLDQGEFDAFATSVRRNLNVRVRALDASWHSACLDLRECLFSDKGI